MDGTRGESLGLLLEGIGCTTALLTAEGDARASALAVWEAWEARVRRGPSTGLAWLARRFELDAFALRVVMLGFALEVEPRMTGIVARLTEDPRIRGATVRVAVDRLCDGPWERVLARAAFLPSAPLVRAGLVVLGEPREPHEGLLDRPLALSGPALRLLLGEGELPGRPGLGAEARLGESLLQVALEPEAIEATRRLVTELAAWREARKTYCLDRDVRWPGGLTVLLVGPAGTGKTTLARALAGYLARPLLTCRAAEVPAGSRGRDVLRELFVDAHLRDAVVHVRGAEALLAPGDSRRATLLGALERAEGLTLLSVTSGEAIAPDLAALAVMRVPFAAPDVERRRQIWELHLPPELPLAADVDVEVLATRYELTGAGIRNAITHAVTHALAASPKAPSVSMALLDAGCRAQLPPGPDELVLRAVTRHGLGDIVLPEKEEQKVREIIAACRNQGTVLSGWGFGRRLATGKGISVLLDGPPGTGKTYCAEIIAGELGRPLMRVNVADVVSKWVGETEKHIRAIFQQARASYGVLLFDEADSLLSSRVADTRTATDKYANMSVNTLLQEIERFEGVSVLTTNLFRGLDEAVIRRIQFRVSLGPPGEAERARIWRVLCPREAPLAADVDFDALAARFETTGAQIKNALLRAAYRACEAGRPIDQATLERACRDEYVAAGRLMRETH